jgi:hypothetical protein
MFHEEHWLVLMKNRTIGVVLVRQYDAALGAAIVRLTIWSSETESDPCHSPSLLMASSTSAGISFIAADN